jgi:hypothetical protein
MSKVKIKFKENKWYNLGDVNPREHGGVFVKRDGNEIETVSIDPLEDLGLYNSEYKGKKGYIIQRRSDYVDELFQSYEQFKENGDKDKGVGNSCDWGRYKEFDIDMESLAVYLATDMMYYSGGTVEHETGTNFWELLGYDGIKPNNYR